MKEINYIDLGFHTGQEIKTMLSTFKDYNINIYGLEGNTKLYNDLKKHYKDKPNIHLYNFCIGDSFQKIKLYLADNKGQGSSIYKDKTTNLTSKFIEVEQTTFYHWFTSLKLKECPTIMKINIEGAESHVIRDMDKYNLFDKIDYILAAYGSLLTDMRKIPSLHKDIPVLEKILEPFKHKIYDIKIISNGLKDKL